LALVAHSFFKIQQLLLFFYAKLQYLDKTTCPSNYINKKCLEHQVIKTVIIISQIFPKNAFML